ncbi:hypothetical protein Scep_002400 [Stephania cephalantha]|uniref:Uncharacterized protein n=1 Tax=Stephania cephalantha TaxID=152367 RepID=A0AAP0LDU8_9MAGN
MIPETQSRRSQRRPAAAKETVRIRPAAAARCPMNGSAVAEEWRGCSPQRQALAEQWRAAASLAAIGVAGRAGQGRGGLTPAAQGRSRAGAGRAGAGRAAASLAAIGVAGRAGQGRGAQGRSWAHTGSRPGAEQGRGGACRGGARSGVAGRAAAGLGEQGRGGARAGRRSRGTECSGAGPVRRWSRRVSGGGGGLAVKMGLEVKWVWRGENGFGGR